MSRDSFVLLRPAGEPRPLQNKVDRRVGWQTVQVDSCLAQNPALVHKLVRINPFCGPSSPKSVDGVRHTLTVAHIHEGLLLAVAPLVRQVYEKHFIRFIHDLKQIFIYNYHKHR